MGPLLPFRIITPHMKCGKRGNKPRTSAKACASADSRRKIPPNRATLFCQAAQSRFARGNKLQLGLTISTYHTWFANNCHHCHNAWFMSCFLRIFSAFGNNEVSTCHGLAYCRWRKIKHHACCRRSLCHENGYQLLRSQCGLRPRPATLVGSQSAGGDGALHT